MTGAPFQRRTLIQLIWPLFVFSGLNLGVTFADTALMSAHSEELAAVVSMANLILDIPYEISAALSFGALALVARALGRGRDAEAQQIAWLAIVTNTILNFALALALWFTAPVLLDWVNTPTELRDGTRHYLHVVGSAMFFNGFLTAGSAILRGYGRTVEILCLGLLANGFYLFFQYVLIFGAWGFPELGVAGAAWSTFVVRGLGVVLIAWVLWKRVSLRPCGFWSSPGAIGRLTEMARLSFPALGESIAFKLFTTSMVAHLALIGTAAVLTRSYTLTLTAFLSLIPYVVSQGNDVLVGYDAGAEAFRTARRRTVRNGLITGCALTLLAAFFYGFSDRLLSAFTDNPAILAGAKELLLITLCMQPFQAMNTLVYNSLRVVGDAYVPVLISLGTTWLVAFPIAWWLVVQEGWGPSGLWLGMAADEILKCLLLGHRWMSMRWTRYAGTRPQKECTT